MVVIKIRRKIKTDFIIVSFVAAKYNGCLGWQKIDIVGKPDKMDLLMREMPAEEEYLNIPISQSSTFLP
jgi:hypothetical protein